MARSYPTVLLVLSLLPLTGCGGGGGRNPVAPPESSPMIVLAYDDVGMHSMSRDFSEFMIFPPFNTLHAQVIDRSGEKPRIVSAHIAVEFSIPGNTNSDDKTNFWQYAGALLGTALLPNIGLTGNGLSGTMMPADGNGWSVTGIPITPITDTGAENAYQLATVNVRANGQVVATTQAVVPVTWEVRCDLCHGQEVRGILVAHDELLGTDLQNQKPVMCGRCHAQARFGFAGSPGVSSLSRAMHRAHAGRMEDVTLDVVCHACHPGERAKSLRDVHASAGMDCLDCHQSMEAVADPGRRPWIDEPRCEDPACHNRPDFEFEQTGKLYRESKGHYGVHCAACHGSPHAITPTSVDADNVQAIALQGHAGAIDTCTVCHRSRPDEGFKHALSSGP